MLDLRTILWCHAQVPVWCWPMLWYWLDRLNDTYILCEMEGRRFVRWHLMRDGRIWVEYWDESDAERAARGARHRDFDRTPWERLAPLGERALWARFVARAAAPRRQSGSPARTGLVPDCFRHGFGLFLARPP